MRAESLFAQKIKVNELAVGLFLFAVDFLSSSLASDAADDDIVGPFEKRLDCPAIRSVEIHATRRNT